MISPYHIGIDFLQMPLTDAVGQMNQNARRKDAKANLVEKAVESLELNGFSVLGPKRLVMLPIQK